MNLKISVKISIIKIILYIKNIMKIWSINLKVFERNNNLKDRKNVDFSKVLDSLILCWKKFFTNEDILKIIKAQKIDVTVNSIIKNFIYKWYIWNLYLWNYFFKIWTNQPSMEEKLVKYLQISSKKYNVKNVKYYFWWQILINKYWISEQVWMNHIVYNNFISWKRKIDWIEIEFKIMNNHSEYFKRWWFYYWTINQIIIDCIDSPKYMWYDYERFFEFLRTNKNYHISQILLLYKKNCDKSWINRFVTIIYKVFWKKIELEKEYQLKKDISLKTLY